MDFVSASNFLLESSKWWDSPYINQFLSADTVGQSYANPQNLNRYGYVLNNPLKYTDPTGHMPCGDGEEHDCNGHKQDPNEDPHLPKPSMPKDDKDESEDTSDGAKIVPDGFCPSTYTLSQCFDVQLPLYMGDDPVEPDFNEFIDLLFDIWADLHQSNPAALRIRAAWYDTPSYDHSFYGIGKLPSVGCLHGVCYRRDELNYVAQVEKFTQCF